MAEPGTSGDYAGAMDRWYEGHKEGHDRPYTTIWMPTETPHAWLDTIERGPGRLPRPHNPPTAHFRLAGITFGGYLDELELYLDAAREAMAAVRRDYEELLAEAHNDAEPLDG